MREYKPRIVDEILKDKLEAKGAVVIEGPKWCGKTTTAMQIARSVLRWMSRANGKRIFRCLRLLQKGY